MKSTITAVAAAAVLLSNSFAADRAEQSATIKRVVSGKAVDFDHSGTIKPGYTVVSGKTVLGTVAQHGDVSLDATADSINSNSGDKGVTTLKGHAVLTVLAAGKPVARFEAAELKLVPLK